MEQPAPDFVHSLQAALTFWRQRLDSASPRQLDAERHNLYRAVRFGLAHGDTQTVAAEVATRAFSFAYARGYWREWLQVMEQAAQASSHLEQEAQFWLLTRLGNLRRLNRDLGGALRAHREALDIALKTDDPHLAAEGYYHLGRAMRGARDYAEALEMLHAGERLLEQLEENDASVLAARLNNALGRVAHDEGRLSDAQAHLERAAERARKSGNRSLLAEQLHDLGNAHRDAGEHEQALAGYEEGLALLNETGQLLEYLRIQYEIGVLHFTRRDYARAEAVFRQINLPFLRETGNLQLEAWILVALGNALLYQERYREAADTLHEGIALWRRLKDTLELANAVGSLGEALAGLGQKEDARLRFNEALTLLAQVQDNAKARRLTAFFQTAREKMAGQTEE